MTLKSRLLSRVHGVDLNGIVWAFEDGKLEVGHMLYGTSQLHPDYMAMVQAAPMMFSTIANTLPALDSLTLWLENNGHDEPVASLLQLQADLQLVEKAALIGPANLNIKRK